jgi:hypothetical protein
MGSTVHVPLPSGGQRGDFLSDAIGEHGSVERLGALLGRMLELPAPPGVGAQNPGVHHERVEGAEPVPGHALVDDLDLPGSVDDDRNGRRTSAPPW